MKNINIKLTGVRRGDTFVCVDGKPLENLQKDGRGNLVCTVATDSDKVNISVCRYLDLGGALWFLTQILFFIISVFGIFDVHGGGRWFSPDCQAEVTLGEANNITVRLYSPAKNGKVAEFTTDLPIMVSSNKYVIDAKTKRIKTALILTKIFTAAVIVITVLICIF